MGAWAAARFSGAGEAAGEVIGEAGASIINMSALSAHERTPLHSVVDHELTGTSGSVGVGVVKPTEMGPGVKDAGFAAAAPLQAHHTSVLREHHLQREDSRDEMCRIRGRPSRIRSAFLLQQERDFIQQELSFSNAAAAEAAEAVRLTAPPTCRELVASRGMTRRAFAQQVVPATRKRSRGSEQEHWRTLPKNEEEEKGDDEFHGERRQIMLRLSRASPIMLRLKRSPEWYGSWHVCPDEAATAPAACPIPSPAAIFAGPGA